MGSARIFMIRLRIGAENVNSGFEGRAQNPI